jgi:hypothetical protein
LSLIVFLFLFSEMNELVLNYLLVEGYKAAADSFVADCGIDTQRERKSSNEHTNQSIYLCFIVVFFQNCYMMMMLLLALRFVSAVHARRRCARHRAAERLCSPILLETRPTRLAMRLQLQRLVELVRRWPDVTTALCSWRAAKLAARAVESAESTRRSLERTMALLAFADRRAPTRCRSALRELIARRAARQHGESAQRCDSARAGQRRRVATCARLLKTIKWCEEPSSPRRACCASDARKICCSVSIVMTERRADLATVQRFRVVSIKQHFLMDQ